MEAAGPCASPPGDRGLAGTDNARDHVTFTGPTTPMTTVWTDDTLDHVTFTGTGAHDHVTTVWTDARGHVTTVWTDARGHGRLRCFSRCPSPGETQSDGLQS